MEGFGDSGGVLVVFCERSGGGALCRFYVLVRQNPFVFKIPYHLSMLSHQNGC